MNIRSHRPSTKGFGRQNRTRYMNLSTQAKESLLSSAVDTPTAEVVTTNDTQRRKWFPDLSQDDQFEDEALQEVAFKIAERCNGKIEVLPLGDVMLEFRKLAGFVDSVDWGGCKDEDRQILVKFTHKDTPTLISLDKVRSIANSFLQ